MKRLILCLLLTGCMMPVDNNPGYTPWQSSCPSAMPGMTVTQACNSFEQAVYDTGCAGTIPPCPFAHLASDSYGVAQARVMNCTQMLQAMTSCTELAPIVESCRLCD